ncbi:MAG: MotA/TolQ/ExbB proton channel family protein [Ilumatobacteraceae bacterium]|nr:MotA/TolQ/ExbB proton channel family protein [Ilumatobacteraceae bacterium]
MPTTVVGILVAIVVAFGVMFAGGMDPVFIFFGSPPSVGLVVVGTLAATFASMALSDSIGGLKAGISTMIKSPKSDLNASIEMVFEFADKARKEGVLALDKVIPEIEDEFLARGIQLVVDGTDPADTKDILELDIDAQAAQVATSTAFWTKAAGFAPAFGVFGTVIGLIDMLNNLSDPSGLGPALAVAFITTLWGVFLANFLFQPIAFKMERNAAIERSLRELQVEGILSLQRGMNPRSLNEKLTVFLPPSKREGAGEQELKQSA